MLKRFLFKQVALSKAVPTIHDVAKAAGVSIATVSYVLNGTGRVSADTAAKVQKVIAKIGYQPNRQAASLTTKRTYTIGTIVRTIQTEDISKTWTNISSEILYQLSAEAIKHGYSMVLIPNTNLNAVKTIGVDALIVSDSLDKDPAFDLAQKLGIPVGTNERPDDKRVTLSVDNGYWQMTVAALDHLKSKGAKRIGLLTEPPELYPDLRVEKAYLTWCDKNKIKPIIQHGNYSKTNTAECIKNLLAKKVDAIYSYYEQGPEILGLLNDLGFKVPRDLMLVAATASDDLENKELGITSVIYRPATQVDEFMDALIDLIEGKIKGPVRLSTRWDLNCYKSTKD